jgi:predicted porin
MTVKNPLSLIALAVMSLASEAALAQGATLYGRMVLSVNHVTTGSNDVIEVRDNASRFGMRGVEDLGGGMAAVYGLEFGLNADTGAATNPMLRNSYVGLRGGWGTIALGRLNSANPTGSPLYSQVTELSHFAPNDAGATATSTSMQNARNRTSNSIGYVSPTWGGFNARARYYLGGAGTATEAEDALKSLDLGLNYKAGKFKAAVGYAKDTRRGGAANNEFKDKWQAGLNYEVLSGLELYALGGVDRYKNTATTRGDVQYAMIGAVYTTGPHKIVVNAFEREVQASRSGDRKRYQLSYQYFLSKRTDLQFFFDNDGIDSSRSNVRVRAIGAGIRHNF